MLFSCDKLLQGTLFLFVIQNCDRFAPRKFGQSDALRIRYVANARYIPLNDYIVYYI